MLLQLTENDRSAVEEVVRSARSSRSQILRAEIVLACAEVSVAAAARRTGVATRTAAKWKARFEAEGMAGLEDTPRAGRPRMPMGDTRRVLKLSLLEPANGRWTTRAIAEASGLSQTTVVRLRQETFPRSRGFAAPVLSGQSVLLSFVYIGSDRRILGFYAPAVARMPSRGSREFSVTRLAEPMETVLCASLVSEIGTRQFESPEPTASLFQRAAAGAPTDRGMTLLLDFVPDVAAERWLARHRGVDAVTVPSTQWLEQLYQLAGNLDSRQLPELADVQQRIREWYKRPRDPFVWTRTTPIYGSGAHSASRRNVSLQKAGDGAVVILGLSESIADGSLHAGEQISERKLSRRLELPRHTVADVLHQLAEDGLINQDDQGRVFVPVPSVRDVSETYTARALLGAAMIRRLASRSEQLPDIIATIFDEVCNQAREGNSIGTGLVDLDLQDELARTAGMPRIEVMFIRLTLQLRLFVTVLGLNYQYPKDDIVEDGHRLLEAIRAHDADEAVALWRNKIDKYARYMMGQLGVTVSSETH